MFIDGFSSVRFFTVPHCHKFVYISYCIIQHYEWFIVILMVGFVDC